MGHVLGDDFDFYTDVNAENAVYLLLITDDVANRDEIHKAVHEIMVQNFEEVSRSFEWPYLPYNGLITPLDDDRLITTPQVLLAALCSWMSLN